MMDPLFAEIFIIVVLLIEAETPVYGLMKIYIAYAGAVLGCI